MIHYQHILKLSETYMFRIKHVDWWPNKLPVIGDRRTLTLEGTEAVKKGPPTVVVMTDTRSMPFSCANLNATSSVKSFESA